MVKKAGVLFVTILLMCLGAGDCWSSEFHGDVVYEKNALHFYLGASISGLLEDFGDPSYDDYFMGGPCYGFNDEIFFVYDESTQEVCLVFASPSAVQVNGVSLDKNRDELAGVLGIPSEEESFFNEMDDENEYIMTYYGSYFATSITLENPNAKAHQVCVSYLEDPSEKYTEPEQTYASPNQNSGSSSNNSLPEGVFVMDGTTREKSVRGAVYGAPSELMTRHFVKFVNIQNPGNVYYGCKIKILTPKNFMGDYETYVIDADGRPGGTVYNVVDAVVID